MSNEAVNYGLAALAALQSQTRPTFHGYAAALRMRPEWRVAFLVFQGGNPRQRKGSLTGGGQMYAHEFEGRAAMLAVPNAPGVRSLVAGGQFPAAAAALAALYGGQQGTGS